MLPHLYLKSTVCALVTAAAISAVVRVRNGEDLAARLSMRQRCQTLQGPFSSFSEFYPFYLCEHSKAWTKLFHFVPTFNCAVFLHQVSKAKRLSRVGILVIVAFVQAYGTAWISHFFIEGNKPATFKYPIYSFMGDWRMFYDALTLKLPPFF